MRRILVVLLFSISLTVPTMAQGVISSVNLGYVNSNIAVDPHGNLLIFDTTYSFNGIVPGVANGIGVTQNTVNIPVTMLPARLPIMPSTKVTVIPGGTGQPVSKIYSGTFEIVGSGKWALYAVATSYSATNNQVVTGARKLVAIDAGPSGTGLPTDLSGFLNTALNPGDVKLNSSTGAAPDTLFNLENGIGPLFPVSATASAVARVERTITFDGTRFNSTDIPLP